MKRLSTLLLLTILCASSAWAASNVLTTNASSCPAKSNTTALVVGLPQDKGGATLTVTGTWTGTISFKGSGDDGTSWVTINALPLASTTAVTSTTANGSWQVNTAGFTGLCMLSSAAMTGSATATITPSAASARSNGGSGGGAVSSVTGAGTVSCSPTTGSVVCTGSGGAGTVTHTVGALTSTAIMTGNGSADSQTPDASATLASNGNMSTNGTVTAGAGGGTTGAVVLNGGTSGVSNITVPASGAGGTMTVLPGTYNFMGDAITNNVTGTIDMHTSTNFFGWNSFACGDTTEGHAGYDYTLHAPCWEITAGAVRYPLSTTGTETATNKRITRRVVAVVTATSITPNTDNADVTAMANTQALGNFTVNADTGTPTDEQQWELRIKSTNVQTFVWNAQYVGGTVALPTVTTGGLKADYYFFIYSQSTTKWRFISSSLGF